MPSIPSKSRRIPPENRFWDKVNICGPDECWEWKRGRYSTGYGMFGISAGHITGAHRFAYTLSKGPIPDGMLVRHTCDNRPCCNPNHLLIGTMADNMADMVLRNRSQKGRSTRAWAIRGEQHYNSKLTEKKVTEIRHKYARGNTSYAKLAKLYKVCIGTIDEIINHEIWTHIP